MNELPDGVPHNPGRYTGTFEAYCMVVGNTVFAAIAGLVVCVSNIALAILGNVKDYVSSVHAMPYEVGWVINKRNTELWESEQKAAVNPKPITPTPETTKETVQ
jgi:hypothetical protein